MAHHLDPQLLAEIKSIAIKAKHLVNTTFAGEYQSAFRGRGMTFDEVREYSPGDDVRSIDWNVTARANKPFIKVFKDERELTVVFMVDLSSSNKFGSRHKYKNEVVAEIAALLSYMALRSNDKVGLLLFSDKIELYVPPKKGRGHVWRLIREILSFESSGKKTNLALPLEFISRVLKHKAVVFMLSDFEAENYEQAFQVAAKRHEMIGLVVSDPLEKQLLPLGLIEFEDAESGERILVNTKDREFIKNYERCMEEMRAELKDLFMKNGVEQIEINSGAPYIHSLLSFFKAREKGRRR